ncbi:membrane dipeptidase [Hyphococcus lacteus]|uniref:Membrane dipeptidase n=1 Tax=Hyphococcus lacteus TaxID=3143536 RepID=A0ABV3YZI2_9PROT
MSASSTDGDEGWTRRMVLAAGGAALATSCVHQPAGGQGLVIDGLSFLPSDPADLGRSGLDGFILDVSKVEETHDEQGLVRYLRTFASCDRGIDEAHQKIETDFPDAYVTTKASDIGKRDGTGIIFQFQSCEPIEDNLDRISYFYDKGLRVLQLTHHHDNALAGGALQENQSGLTKLGRDGIAEMNRLGIIPDVSHSSQPTAIEVASASTRPIILSHGACRAIVDNPRCATDAMIKAVSDTGGVMGVFMMSFWLTTEKVPTIDHYIDQLMHVANVGGIDATAIANDYSVSGLEVLTEIDNNNAEGVKGYHSWWNSISERGVPGYDTLPEHVVIPELNNVNRMFLIRTALEKRGVKSSMIDKIMGENWRRVLTSELG